MKKLLRDAWRAVTRINRDGSRPLHDKGSDTENLPNPEVMAADAAFDDALNAHQAGRLQEAQAVYRRILESMPDHAQAMHFLGVSHGQAGNLVEAERLIRQSIQIQQSSEYFSNLALVLDAQGKRDEAVSACRRSIALTPANVAMHRNLGGLLVGASRYAEAEQAYRGVLALQPDDADTHFKIAEVLVALNRLVDAVDAYRRALMLRPEYPEASNNLGNLLKGMRRYAEAEDAYKQTLLLQPGAAAVYCNLGQLFQEGGRHNEAEAAIRRALELQPDLAGAHNSLGNFYAAKGRYPEAEAAIRRALELQPDYADAHNNLGNLLKEMGRHSDAEGAYRQALDLNPHYAEAWGNLGMLLAGAEQFTEAETAHRKALSLKPDSAAAYHNLANLLCKTNRNAEAEAAYRQALALDPNYAEVCVNLGTFLHANGRTVEAEDSYRKALGLKPDSVAAHNNFGSLLMDIKRYDEAEALFSRALILQPDSADACNSQGNLFKETGRYTEAEAAYRHAIALHPDTAGFHNNLGFLLQGVGRYAEAEAAYRQALTLDPDFDLAHYNLALTCLSQKQFIDGWKGYERRWKIKDFNSLQRPFPQEKWRGDVLAGQTLLLWQEQGVGDIIIYAGMLPDLVAQGVRLVVECESRFVPLLARSFPQANVLARSNPAHVTTQDARWQSPMGSLGRWLRTRQEDFKWRGPYLVPDAMQVAAFKKRYQALGRGPVIGVSWRSSNPKIGESKSLSLAEWAPLLALPGATFINLQYGDCEEELSRLKRDTGITVHHDSTVNSLKDLDGFAAQVAATDLVISTSNSTVHFAGALGIPVWTLLPRGGAGLLWYWFDDDDDSLWYPSMRLFRQDSAGDWPGLMARVTEACRNFLMASC